MPRRKGPRFLRVLRVRARRLASRLDRQAPEWLTWLPPWGMSLLLHGLIVLLLAILLFLGRGRTSSLTMEVSLRPPQLKDDLTSLAPSDHAGDPFTKEKTEESPSLVLEPKEEDPDRSNQPELPPGTRLAAEIANTPQPPDFEPERPAPSTPKGRAIGLTAPFSGRQGDAKARLLRREGGSVESEKAVEAGLDWLVRHQRDDGGWSLNFQGQCRGSKCPAQALVDADAAATGLALLPLLGAGHVPNQPGRYHSQVARGVRWLVDHQKEDGDLFVGTNSNAHMYGHAIAAMALCEAYGLSRDPTLHEPAQRAIDFIVRAQNRRDGGWRYQPGQRGDTSVFGWQMMALRSGRMAGLTLPKLVLKGARYYLDHAMTDKSKAFYAYQPGQGASPVMTAEALLVRQYLGWPRDLPALTKGTALVLDHFEKSGERNVYFLYYATQLLHNLQGPAWTRWNSRVRDELIGMQVAGTGCDRGSWSPERPRGDRWGGAGGRLYVTSLSLLTLEVYYRYLPLYRTTDREDMVWSAAAPGDREPPRGQDRSSP